MSSMDLVIERTAQGIELAWLIDGRLENFERREETLVTDCLFRARVSDIDRTLDGAFLDAGEPSIGAVFIQGRDLKRAAGQTGKKKRQSIERIIEVGRSLLVQGSREVSDDKGARVTQKLRIGGRFLVLAPTEQHHALSPRCKGHERDRLLEQLAELRPVGGLIARRLAMSASHAELADEVAQLVQFWESLSAKSARPGRVPGFLDPIDAAIWQALDWPVDRVMVGDVGLSARLRRIAERCPGAFEIEVIEARGSVFDATGVGDDLVLATTVEVPLNAGGRILIEETAACVAIDVDGGGQPALQANLAAAEEIGRQCRLRNLGGTIIVDFIDMPTKPQIQRLEEAVRKYFRSDPLPIQILPLSPLGICQISRAKRGGNPFANRQSVCPTCGGQGVVGA